MEARKSMKRSLLVKEDEEASQLSGVYTAIIPSEELEVKAAHSGTGRRGEGRLGCEWQTVGHVWGAPRKSPVKKEL